MAEPLERLSAALADRYAIERELGAGGMATVYLAHDVRHDRKVALKVLRPELAAILGGERFLKEIRLTANLQHPHVLPLHDSGEAEGIVYYVMPYVEGESLRERLTREKQLPVEDAVRIAREVASALDYAHRHQVVHRDIKPENILLHDGQALVADFGIALAVSSAGGGTRMTETGMSLGTPHYMSPEQAMGEREITPRADVYALGVVLYEMLTGDPPFTGSTAQAIVARVVTEGPRPLLPQRHTIPPHVEAAVLTALEKLPADRFASAAQFAEALGRTDFTMPATRVTPAAAPARGPALRRLVPLVPWVLLAVAGAAAVWGWLRTPRATRAPVARLTITIPGVELLPFIPVPSPDGSRIAFMGVDSQRVQRLFLRSLEREEVVPIPGTQGVSNSPFFSPDGEWLVYRQGGKLRKVSLSGGAAAVLCDAGGATGIGYGGGAWGSRGDIVFALGGTLLRVGAAGGAVDTVLTPDSAAGTINYVEPAFLPDGSRFLAVRQTSTGSTELVAIILDERRVVPLGVAGNGPAWVDGGYVVYTDPTGTAFFAPFDARRLRFSGEPGPLAEDVLVSLGLYPRLRASRSGAITYYTGTASGNMELMMVDRRGTAEAIEAPHALYQYPRFSPDGRRLAVSVPMAASFFGDIWSYELGSRRLTRLTFDSSGVFPEWTPDGRHLLYARRVRGRGVQVYRVAADGSSDPEPFFARPGSVFEGRLTPDGRELVFREENVTTGRDVFVARVDSPASLRPLAATNFNEAGLALSPDGRWLAFTSNLSGTPEIYVRRLEAGSPRWRVSTGGGTEPRWGPGGRELFYRNSDTLYAVSATLGAEARFGEPQALFAGRFVTSTNEPMYDVSPDGRRFLTVRVSGSRDMSLHLLLHWFDQLRAQRR